MTDRFYIVPPEQPANLHHRIKARGRYYHTELEARQAIAELVYADGPRRSHGGRTDWRIYSVTPEQVQRYDPTDTGHSTPPATPPPRPADAMTPHGGSPT